jgi:peptide/nickel transport system substrate-binding protein
MTSLPRAWRPRALGSAALLALALLLACAPSSQPPASGPAASSGGGGAAGSVSSGASAQPAAAAPAGQPRRGGTLVVGQDVVPNGFDPHLLTATPFVSQMISEHLYNGLARLDESLQPVPDVAERWDTSDYQTFVFHLRRGVKFHNGREMTAADVLYSLDRMADPTKTDRPRTWLREAQVQAADAYTVQIALPRPDAAFLVRLAHPDSAIVAREAVEQHGNLQQVAMGTGPFRLVEEVPGVHIRLERNPDYFLPDRPYLDGIVFKMITDEPTRLANIRSGDVDATRLYDPKNARLLANNQDVVVLEGPSLTRDILFMNFSRPPLDDVRVRQAISLALNRDEIIKGAVFGAGAPLGAISPALKDWSVSMTSLPNTQPNATRARELLAAAGHASGLRFTIKVSGNFPQDVAAAQILQAQLKPVGIETEVVPLEWGALNQDARRAEFDLLIHPLLSEPDPDAYTQPYKAGVLLNYGKYSNARLEELIDRGVTTPDKVQRKTVYDEMQRLIDQEVVNVALFSQNRIDVVRKGVKGYTQSPTGSRVSYRDTWLEK